MNKNRIFILLLFTSTLLFVAYLILLSYNNRLCSDDLYFLSDFIDKGWFKSIAEFPFNKRWSSFLLFNTIFIFNHDFQTLHWNIFIYNIITFLLLIFSFYSLFKVLFFRIFSDSVHSFYILLTVLLFIVSFYFSTSQSIEVWFWTIASPIYLYPIIFFALGLANILSEKKSFVIYFVIIFSFLFIGGALENYAFIIIFLVSLFIILYYFSKNFIKISIVKLWIAWISLCILFIINLFSSSVTNRISLEYTHSEFCLNLEWGRFINSILHIKTLIFGFYLFNTFVMGYYFREKSLILSKLKLINAVIYNLLFLLIVAFLTFLPLIYIFHSLGSERAWLPLNFFICASLFAWSFYFGNRFLKFFKIFSLTKNIIALISVFIISFYIYKHFPVISKFSEKYDARIDTLIQLKKNGNKKPVYLNPLPDSGPLASQELDSVNFRTNIGLEKVLKLNFKVYLNNNMQEK